MNRQEAIQRIIWSLLAHASEPHQAVAAALTVKPYLGNRAEGDFRNLLRAAGLFAHDDDGFFIRYVRRILAQTTNAFPSMPSPTHLLTVPVPVEPRMRIAYSVFTGLLLKHLYQSHVAVPLQVSEGMAFLCAPEQPPAPASPLPDSAEQVWHEFQSSKLAESALQDGIEAALSAVERNIGAIAVTDSLARGALFRVLLEVLPRHEREFQTQGGMRLDYYSRQSIEKWRKALAINFDSAQTVESLWTKALNESGADNPGKNIAGLIVLEALGAAKPMTFRYVRGLWRGEGSGTNRNAGNRDRVWPQNGDKNFIAKAEAVGRSVEEALARLERERCGTNDLDERVAHACADNEEHRTVISSIVSQLAQAKGGSTRRRKSPSVSAEKLVGEVSDALRKEALIAFLAKNDARALRELNAAVSETCKNIIAWELAQDVVRDDIAIFGWPRTILLNVPKDKRFTLRFINKQDPPGARTILKVPPLGNITLGASQNGVSLPPFSLTGLRGSSFSAKPTTYMVASGSRCIVCGSMSELLKGAISFLPESKKRWYESPTSFVEPNLCSNCAFVAYLSAIYPNRDTSVVEFPSDNFLELFALHEHLQGISGAVALKTINRVASLAILPSRYLLLSKNSRQGRMDSKTQTYVQLRHHTPLLQKLDRTMRVQIEGAQPNSWSEIYPHVAVGLSYFARLPRHYETGERKVLAQRLTRALVEGRPFGALYLGTQAEQPERGFGWERSVLTRGLRSFENDFVRNTVYSAKMARALGGENMSNDFYDDVIDFSNYLLDLVRPLVQREVQKSGSAVSGIVRKYTDLIVRDFGQSRSAKFLYVISQEADSAERDGDGWAKWQLFGKLYGARPAVEGKSGEDAARLWSEFRDQHPRTVLETKIEAFQKKHGTNTGVWSKFLTETQARTLALLMLNVRNVSNIKQGRDNG